MTQANITIADGKGSEVLASLNQAFLAVSTLQSGEQEPSIPLPFMLWADITNQQLKIRHSNNTEWITLGSLDTPGLFEAPRVVAARQGFLKRVAKVLRFEKSAPTDDSALDQKAA